VAGRGLRKMFRRLEEKFVMPVERLSPHFAQISMSIGAMDRTWRQKNARDVRDQLEQALYTLPRQGDQEAALALQIEEAIEIAMELEHLRLPQDSFPTHPMANEHLRKSLRSRKKPRMARIWT
jgi:hypothetical protein